MAVTPRILFVDDAPERLAGLASRDAVMATAAEASTVLEALNKLREHGPWDIIFLDRDMGEDRVMDPYPHEPSGEDIAYLLAGAELQWKPRLVVVHSMNFERAKLIVAILRKANIRTMRIPFTVLVNSPLINLWREAGW
jgi:CheY-like chemotaxis protein